MDAKRAAEVLQDISTAKLSEINEAEDMSVQALLAWGKVATEGVMPRFTMDGRWRFVFQGWDGRLIDGNGNSPLTAVLDAMSEEGKG